MRSTVPQEVADIMAITCAQDRRPDMRCGIDTHAEMVAHVKRLLQEMEDGMYDDGELSSEDVSLNVRALEEVISRTRAHTMEGVRAQVHMALDLFCEDLQLVCLRNVQSTLIAMQMGEV